MTCDRSVVSSSNKTNRKDIAEKNHVESGVKDYILPKKY